MSEPHLGALDAFLSSRAGPGWGALPFFRDGPARLVCRELDRLATAGTHILPPASELWTAFALTPLDAVKVVILGQDPYPTPGHAHGLAFSCLGAGPLPASLRRIFRELSDDLGTMPRRSGDLTDWAAQGVLLLNAALSVEAGRAGAHLRLGWQALADQSVAAVSARGSAAVFILWGDKARARKPLVDPRHLVIESAHPSPLAARGDFLGSKPFSRANRHLAANGLQPIDWG